jgi:hypothetical protein
MIRKLYALIGRKVDRMVPSEMVVYSGLVGTGYPLRTSTNSCVS